MLSWKITYKPKLQLPLRQVGMTAWRWGELWTRVVELHWSLRYNSTKLSTLPTYVLLQALAVLVQPRGIMNWVSSLSKATNEIFQPPLIENNLWFTMSGSSAFMNAAAAILSHSVVSDVAIVTTYFFSFVSLDYMWHRPQWPTQGELWPAPLSPGNCFGWK